MIQKKHKYEKKEENEKNEKREKSEERAKGGSHPHNIQPYMLRIFNIYYYYQTIG
jgi:archaellum component FlaC